MKKLIIVNSVIFSIVFFAVFYIGSVNANYWGKWEDFEIVFVIMMAFILSVFIFLPVVLTEFLYFRKKKK